MARGVRYARLPTRPKTYAAHDWGQDKVGQLVYPSAKNARYSVTTSPLPACICFRTGLRIGLRAPLQAFQTR